MSSSSTTFVLHYTLESAPFRTVPFNQNEGTRDTKKGKIQRYKCQDCKKRFTANFGFEKRQFDDHTITGALQMYYTGMSVRDIADHYSMMGIDVSFKTIYNWGMCSRGLRKLFDSGTNLVCFNNIPCFSRHDVNTYQLGFRLFPYDCTIPEWDRSKNRGLGSCR